MKKKKIKCSLSPWPWEVRNCAEVFDANNNGVCVPFGISDQDKNNARLIAAAPEMLVALECLANEVIGSVIYNIPGEQSGAEEVLQSLVDRARKIIDKAKGKK